MQVKEFSEERRKEQELRAQLMQGCTRFLSGNGLETPHETLRELAEYSQAHGVDSDRYGVGKFLNSFEEEIAALLGMESAVFMPSGVMAQQIALRIWADRAQNKNIALHRTSHVEANEELGYRHLHGLQASFLGEDDQPFTSKDIEECPASLSAVLLELPYRRLGGILPGREELDRIKQIAKEKNIRLHLDGARLWESQPFYGRTLSEICEGFDSVYVSFYKGLGGLTGSMLCGPSDFIQEARIWQRRHGGTLYHLYPYVVSAKLCFDKRRDLFSRYYDRALAIARTLHGIEGVSVKPSTPQTPMMHVHIQRDLAALNARRDQIAKEDRLWIGGFLETETPGVSLLEISVGDATLSLPDEEIRSAVLKLVPHPPTN